MTVDTDERLSFPGFHSPDELRRALNSDPDVLVWLVPCRDGSYAKERFIRVPTQLVWKGRTHEALVGATERQRRILHGVEFFEEPKTPEQFRAKLHRDLEVLRVETQEQPDNPRWWYEASYDVLRFTWRALGQTQRADECERKFLAAQAKRGQHWTGAAGPAAGVPAAAKSRSPGSPRPAKSLGETRPRGFATGDKADSPHRERAPGTHAVRVAVLGLYSSGSTATAGVLHHLGVCMGRQFPVSNFRESSARVSRPRRNRRPKVSSSVSGWELSDWKRR